MLFCIVVGFLAVLSGCREAKKTTAESEAAFEAAEAGQFRDDMLLFAIDRLNTLEEYVSPDTLRQLVERLDPQRPATQEKRQSDPILSIWPEPETLRQVVDRLNQWARGQQLSADWAPDPMTAELPKPYRELPAMQNLAAVEFTQFDGFSLLETVWLRDIVRWARGETLDDLHRAEALFDWTVRNIQLDADSPNRIPQFPWETLLFGRGTASERAWVFILLLRQLDIDAAMLAIEEKTEGEKGKEQDERPNASGLPEKAVSEPNASGLPEKAVSEPNAPGPRSGGDGAGVSGSLRPWCVGVLVEGEVYLFDLALGLPIPDAGGPSLDDAGRLTIRPATLAQAAADPQILSRLNAGDEHAYRVRATDLRRVAALLEASPAYLARRMKMLESRLTAARKMALTTSPAPCAKRWKAAAGVADCRLWSLPYETLERRGRLGPKAALAWAPELLPLFAVYEERQVERARTSRDPLEYQQDSGGAGSRVIVHAAPLFKGRVLYLKGKFTGDDGAAQCFQIARPSNELLVKSSADIGEKQVKLWAKLDASYWSGILAYQQGNYATAVDFLMRRTLEAFSENNPWTHGARYNLARAYEASGERERAILLYRGNADSPGYHGDLLRAQWIEEAEKERKKQNERRDQQ